MATSQNGWPALSQGSPKLHTWVIPGTNRHFVCRNGSAGFLLAFFIHWFHNRVESLLLPGPWDEWAFAFRPVRDSNDLSNHASGTAVDLNATRHPLGKRGTFWYKVRNVYAATRIRTCLRMRMAGTLRWGGDYQNRADEMHFELNVPLAKAEKRARRLMKTKRGKLILEANPGQKRVILS